MTSERKYEVPFTEFVAPHGRRRDLLWPTTDRALWAKADAIIASGFTFEIERLGNGIVSATITHADTGDMACILSRNDRSLTVKITDMIKSFDINKQLERVERLLNDNR